MRKTGRLGDWATGREIAFFFFAPSPSRPVASSPCMNQGFQFPAEFHVDLSGADLDDDAYAELRMIDAVTRDELLLHRIGAQRADLFGHGRGVFFRAPRRRASRRGSGRALTVDVIAVTGAALDASDGAVGVDGGDDV